MRAGLLIIVGFLFLFDHPAIAQDVPSDLLIERSTEVSADMEDQSTAHLWLFACALFVTAATRDLETRRVLF